MSRRQGRLIISSPLMTLMMKDHYTELNENDLVIRGIKYNAFTDTIEILLEGESMPEVAEGGIPIEL